MQVGLDSLTVKLIKDAGIGAIEIIQKYAPDLWRITYQRSLVGAKVGLIFGSSFLIFGFLCFISMIINQKRDNEGWCVFWGILFIISLIIGMVMMINGYINIHSLEYQTLYRIFNLIKIKQ